MNIIVDRGDLIKSAKNQPIKNITITDINFKKQSFELIRQADCIIFAHGNECKVLKHRNLMLIDPIGDINIIPSVIYKAMEQNPDTRVNLYDHITSLVELLTVPEIIQVKALVEREAFKKL